MDKGQQATERNMRQLVQSLKILYGKAAKDLLTQLQAYIKPYEKDGKKKLEQLERGEIKEDDYRFWLRCKAFRGEPWDVKVKALLLTIGEANKNALRIVRGGQLLTFADNANFYASELGKIGIRFDIFDRATVERLLRDNPQLLPNKVLNAAKDAAYNRRIVNNAVTHGIILGESVPKIADRISGELAHLNKDHSIRYARTAVTAAQNAGRVEQMKAAEKMGIRCQKQWLSTHDSRVRDTHLGLDGQIRDIDEPFDSDLGEIMYPGDPAADPANVWNCRCCLVHHFPDYQP